MWPALTGVSSAAVLDCTALSILLPMHIRLSPEGRILAFGATLARIVGPHCSMGEAFLSRFTVHRPKGICIWPDLHTHQGKRLTLVFNALDDMHFCGIAVATRDGGLLLNLSFGIGVVEGVRRFGLTQGDFSPTDLTVEMLYLVEAKSAIMEELQRLTTRLDGARHLAREEALTDPLTRLRNRRACMATLERLCRVGQPFGLMHLDLDRFKAVNDTLGHAAGDHVLMQVAEVLRSETRETDTVARLGGDEFVLIFHGTRDVARLLLVGQRLIDRLSVPIPYEGQVCQIGASIGVTLSQAYAAPSPEEVLSDADDALYAAKRAGRGRMSVSDRLTALGRADPSPSK